jgi:hypothetical protein
MDGLIELTAADTLMTMGEQKIIMDHWFIATNYPHIVRAFA